MNNGNNLGAIKITPEMFPDNSIFRELIGQGVLVVAEAAQLNILGRTFRPIFCGTLAEVNTGFITLNPAIIKMVNAPFFNFPTPLSIPIERIVSIMPFDCDTRLPLI